MPSVQLSSRGIRIARSNAEVAGSPSPVPAATQSVNEVARPPWPSGWPLGP